MKRFESFLKLTTELCTYDQRTHIKREDDAILQVVGNVALSDT